MINPTGTPAKPPRLTTLEEALRVCAAKIASPQFAERVRQNGGGAFDLTFTLQVKHHRDAFNVVLDFRKKTPACPLLVIQDVK